jgi:hypothetical protein
VSYAQRESINPVTMNQFFSKPMFNLHHEISMPDSDTSTNITDEKDVVVRDCDLLGHSGGSPATGITMTRDRSLSHQTLVHTTSVRVLL